MEEIAKVVLFFFRVEAAVVLIFVIMRVYDSVNNGSTISLKQKSDTEILYGLTVLAILASLVYSWCI